MLKTFVCKYVVQYNDNLQKKNMSGTTTKMLSRKMNILQKYLSRRQMQNLQCISMAKYWHAV